MRYCSAASLAALLFCLSLQAQNFDPRVEIGVQIGVVDLRDALGEKPIIAGGRASFRLLRYLQADTEVNRFPLGGGYSSYPATEFLFGARVIIRPAGFGFFAKFRPGFVHFDSGNRNVPALGNRPLVELGGGLEFYSKLHIFTRIDFADLVVFYGNPAFGTRHQMQMTFGMGAWF